MINFKHDLKRLTESSRLTLIMKSRVEHAIGRLDLMIKRFETAIDHGVSNQNEVFVKKRSKRIHLNLVFARISKLFKLIEVYLKFFESKLKLDDSVMFLI